MRKFKKQWAETLTWTELVHLVELYVKPGILQAYEDEYQKEKEGKRGSGMRNYTCMACHHIYLRATEPCTAKKKPVDGLVISRFHPY